MPDTTSEATDAKLTGTRKTQQLVRVAANLTPRAVQALEQAIETTGDTQTDTINRAIQVYAYLEETLKNGGEIYTRNPGSQELVNLRFI